MITKLWLDDERPAPEGWIWVDRVQDAQDWLESTDVTELSLDHDLGEGVPTGHDLVSWMVATGHWPRLKPTIHSANPVGRANMQALIEAHWVPR